MDEEFADEIAEEITGIPDQQEVATPIEELSIESLVEQLTKERDEFKDMALRVQESLKIFASDQQCNKLTKSTAIRVDWLKVCWRYLMPVRRL